MTVWNDAPVTLAIAFPALAHVFHALTSERSGFRLWFLRLYVIYEVRFLRLVLRVLESRLGRTRAAESLIWWGFGAWLKKWGETGRAMSRDEVRVFFETLPPEFETAVGGCRCKVARGRPCGRFFEGKCTHPTETEIAVRWGTPFYREGYPGEYRVISRADAVRTIEGLRALRHAPHIYFFCVAGTFEAKEFVICNCCKGACVPLEVNRRGMPIMTRGLGRAVIDRSRCTRCFTCREVCLYEVVADDHGEPAIGDCHGCAVCARNCPAGAITLTTERSPDC